MLDGQTLEKLKDLASQVATRESCKLYDLEFIGAGKGRTLRVYIDKAGEDSVSVEDCSNVSNGLNLLLDVEDVIPGGAYSLEVSSPGLERHLRTGEHFSGAIGETIFLKTRSSFGSFNSEFEEKLGARRQGQVKLLGLEELDTGFKLNVEIDGMTLLVPGNEIDKSHVIFEFEDKTPPKKGNTQKTAKKRKSKKR